MSSPLFDSFAVRILFAYKNGREIMYVYDREHLDQHFQIKHHSFDDGQYISIGDVLNLEGHSCKVVDINFKLYEGAMDTGHPDVASASVEFNCQVGVFVERLSAV